MTTRTGQFDEGRSRRTIVIAMALVALLSIPAQCLDYLEGPITNPTTGHAYYIVAAGSWTEAQSEAESIGGNLVTIRNAEENAWIVNNLLIDYPGESAPKLSNHPVWIGLHNPSQNANAEPHASNFVWVSGEQSTYTNWHSTEPNNYRGYGEFYTAIQWHFVADLSSDRGNWNDCPVDGTTGTPGNANTVGPYYGIAEVVQGGEGEGELEGEGEEDIEGEDVLVEGELEEGEIIDGEGEALSEGEGGEEFGTCGCCRSVNMTLSPKDLFNRTLGDWLVIGASLLTFVARGLSVLLRVLWVYQSISGAFFGFSSRDFGRPFT